MIIYRGRKDVLKFKKLDPSAKIFEPRLEGDVGYDLCSIHDGTIKPGTSTVIRTGLSFEIPDIYYAQLHTRSGYGVKKSLRIHPGIIDSGYRGEITIRIYNFGKRSYGIKKGDKIAQLVIKPRIVLPLKEVKELTESERGSKGLGSTGR